MTKTLFKEHLAIVKDDQALIIDNSIACQDHTFEHPCHLQTAAHTTAISIVTKVGVGDEEGSAQKLNLVRKVDCKVV
jgi:hypothetical protein